MISAMLLPFVAAFIVAAAWFVFRSFLPGSGPRPKMPPRQRGFYIAGIVVLLAGLTAAGLVYQSTADNFTGDDAVSYTMEGGGAYAVRPAENKRYNRQMEQIGGKANVFASEVQSEFFNLWHGEELAVVLAILACLGFLICLVAGRLAGVPTEPDEPTVRE